MEKKIKKVEFIKRIDKIKCKDWDFFFEYENVNNCSINYKSLSANKNYLKKIEDKFKKPI